MKAPVAAFIPISCQSHERSELIFTETTAILLRDGRRRKECSAIYPSLRGCYLNYLGFKGCFEEEQMLLATFLSLTQELSYAQGKSFLILFFCF